MKRQLSFESLENKVVLSADVSLIADTGELFISGTGQDDLVQVHHQNDQVEVRVDNVDSYKFNYSDVTKITFIGRNGDDTFTNNTNIKAAAFGSLGNDVLNGGSNDDRLNGGKGDDECHGRGGDDNLIGGDGNDDLYGEGDDDVIKGGRGNDDLMGGNGVDQLFGAAGVDMLFGHEGDDGLFGGGNADKIFGGAGNDTANGGGGNDWIRGFDGDDFLVGASGNDTILGDAGNDTLLGRDGDDFMDGQDGNDVVTGNTGNDRLRGGDGIDEMNGGAGDDYMSGGRGEDDLSGGDGHDRLNGGEDDDSLHGDHGDDYLNGHTGDDDLLGGSGNDHYQNDDDDYIDDKDSDHVDENEIHHYVRLTSATGASGKVEVELEQEHSGLKRELEIKVQGLDRNTSYDIMVNDEVIGSLTTDSYGFARVDFSDVPDSDELPLNLDSKIVVGTTIKVGTVLTGTIETPDSNNGYFVDDDEDYEDDNEARYFVNLSGLQGYGKAEIEIEKEDDGNKIEVEIKVKKLAANSTFDILVDSEKIGSLKTNFEGEAEIKFSTEPDDDELLLVLSSDLGEGSVIKIGNALEGTV